MEGTLLALSGLEALSLAGSFLGNPLWLLTPPVCGNPGSEHLSKGFVGGHQAGLQSLAPAPGASKDTKHAGLISFPPLTS